MLFDVVCTVGEDAAIKLVDREILMKEREERLKVFLSVCHSLAVKMHSSVKVIHRFNKFNQKLKKKLTITFVSFVVHSTISGFILLSF